MANVIKTNNDSKKTYIFVLFAITLFFQSFASVCIKFAGKEAIFSSRYILFIALAFIIMMGYAFSWQLLLEHVPLSIAYLRKGISYILILIWAMIFFGETLTIPNIIGSIIIIIGISVGASDD